MPSVNNIAFTAPINPPGASPVLKKEQVWAGLLLKTRSAETFIPNAIESTTVISENEDASTGNIVTIRDVVFRENQKKVKETVMAYKDARVDFVQPDGSFIGNIISEGASGELYMTYVFEWHHPGASQDELDAFYAREKGIAQHSVEGTVDVIRNLVKEGKL
uniref:Flap endonuclease 1 n=1 Tax=Talaromyces marneffei PM1 TaxID=1077442 RepID=A0A093VXR0_TALMA